LESAGIDTVNSLKRIGIAKKKPPPVRRGLRFDYSSVRESSYAEPWGSRIKKANDDDGETKHVRLL